MVKKSPTKNPDLATMRHSCSHLLAAAVKKLYPGTKLGIGPATKEGFYYDFQFPSPISENELSKIEKEMALLVAKDLKFKKKEISTTEAKKLFKNQPYKLEIIKDTEQEAKNQKKKKVTIYTQGDFTDLCQGPHLKSSSEIGAFKLLSIAGAYWKGSENNPMLTRIYGTCFQTQTELKKYLKKLKESEKRDHRKLGQKLELFSLPEEFGGGLVLWLPKGSQIRKLIEDFWRSEHEKKGYLYVNSPHIAHSKLWEISGHTKFYKENMYSEIKIDNERYRIKPMNCPFHIFIYKNKIRSYKDLPFKTCELGTVYRYERSGTLHGLTRVRGFTQDDAHIFITKDKLKQEIDEILGFALRILKKFGFSEYEIDLSLRDSKNKSKYMGGESFWQEAEKSLEEALQKRNLNYTRAPGEAVFYGPKIDIKIKDALNRPWQCTTIQIDFNLPEKFNLEYIDKRGRKKRPILIHRAIFGSLERFLGVLIEHYGGVFPLWLAPTQCQIINIGSAHKAYAQEVKDKLTKAGIRCQIDLQNKTVAKKILESTQQKIPYVLVVGDKERKSKSVNVRDRAGRQRVVKLDRFIKIIQKEIQEDR